MTTESVNHPPLISGSINADRHTADDPNVDGKDRTILLLKGRPIWHSHIDNTNKAHLLLSPFFTPCRYSVFLKL